MGSALGNASAARDHGQRWIDVRDFGASPSASGKVNRTAIQAAIDSVDNSAGAGGTVYIPSGTYQIDRPLFLDKARANVTGDGSTRTILRTALDGFVGGILRNVTDPRSASPTVTAAHFVDLYTGGPGGTPYLDNTAVTGPNKKWGIRTLANHHACCMGGAFDSGLNFDWYGKTRKLTIDACVDMTNSSSWAGFPNSGCLFGISSGSVAYPWNLSIGSSAFKFQFRTADNSVSPMGGVDRVFYFGASALTTPKVFRITIQVDLINCVVAAWIDGVQQTLVNVNLGANWSTSANLTFCSNYYAPFTLGSNSGQCSTVTDGSGGPMDTTFCGLKVSADAIYAVGSAGSSQARVDNAAINDNNRYFTANSTTIGLLPLTDSGTTTNVLNDRVLTFSRGQGGGTTPTAAYFLDNYGHSGPYSFCTPGDVSNLTIQGNGNTGTAYVAGFCYGINVFDCGLLGGTRGFACFNMGSNYPITIRNCFIGGIDTPLYFYYSGFILVTEMQTATSHRTTCRSVYSNPTIKHSFVLSGGGQPDFMIQSIKGGFEIDGVFWDNESVANGGGIKAFAYASPWNSNPLDGVIRITNCSPGRLLPGAPVVHLDETAPTDGKFYFPATFYMENVYLYDSGARTIVKTNGTRWQGEIKAVGNVRRPTWVDNVGPGGVGAIVAKHPYYTGPPRDGTWQFNSHVLEAASPGIGHYTRWRVLTPGSYGTAKPPTWAGLDPQDDGVSLAAYIADHSYWNVSGAPSDAQGYWSNTVHATSLNALFGGPALVAPGTLKAGLGVYRATRYTGQNSFELSSGNGFGYARIPLTGTPFGTSSGGVVTNTQAITFNTATGPWVTDPNPFAQINALMLLDNAGNMMACMDIATTVVTTGNTLSIPIGAVALSPAAGSGQGVFATRVHDMVNNFWLNGATFTAPTIYLALSTAPASVTTPPTEPSGGSYARLATTSASWARVQAATYNVPGSVGTECVVRNALALTFPAPTGDWGTVRSVYLMDSPSGGNVLAAANLTIPRTIAAGDPARAFAPGALWICRS